MSKRGILLSSTLLAVLSSCGCGGGENGLGPPTRAGASFRRVRADSSGDWATIQSAIDRASPGDTIAVAEGTYAERLRITKSVKLLGGWNSTFTVRDPTIHETVLDGESSGTVVTLEDLPDTSAVVDGFVITGGGGGRLPNVLFTTPSFLDDFPGSGIFCNSASPVLSRNVIRGNVAAYGAGIRCFRGSARIRSNTITENVAGVSGGGILCVEFSGEVEANNIISNYAGTDGGGLYLAASAGRVVGDTIAVNRAGHDGGGIFCLNSDTRFESVFINENDAERSGGGVFGDRPSNPLFDMCGITHNRAEEDGGGIYCHRECSPQLTSCLLSENTAVGNGGGIYCRTGLNLLRTEVVGNEATRGGGLWCDRGADVESRRCVFDANSAAQGGAVVINQETKVEIYRNTLVGNETGCLYVIGGDVLIEASLLVDTQGDVAVYCWQYADIGFLKNDFWDNSAGHLGGVCVDPVFPDPNGNISVDPLFCAPDVRDYRLQPGSPAVVAPGDTLGALGCCPSVRRCARGR